MELKLNNITWWFAYTELYSLHEVFRKAEWQVCNSKRRAQRHFR